MRLSGVRFPEAAPVKAQVRRRFPPRRGVRVRAGRVAVGHRWGGTAQAQPADSDQRPIVVPGVIVREQTPAAVLAQTAERDHASHTLYCAVTTPSSGLMKWSRCDGRADAASCSRAYLLSDSVLPVWYTAPCPFASGHSACVW